MGKDYKLNCLQQFFFQNSSDSLNWKYTYVTSDQPESLEVPGSDRRIMLHIFASVDRRERLGGGGPGEGGRRAEEAVEVPVKAQFLVDGQTTRLETIISLLLCNTTTE